MGSGTGRTKASIKATKTHEMEQGYVPGSVRTPDQSIGRSQPQIAAESRVWLCFNNPVQTLVADCFFVVAADGGVSDGGSQSTASNERPRKPAQTSKPRVCFLILSRPILGRNRLTGESLVRSKKLWHRWPSQGPFPLKG